MNLFSVHFAILACLLLPLPTFADILSHQRYLVVLAHPDDETWLSGTLAQLAQNNKDLLLVYATSGGAGQDRSGQQLTGSALAKAREKEGTLALQALGIKTPPVWLNLPDTRLQKHEAKLLQQLKHSIQHFQPDCLISFDDYGVTGHKDHQLVASVTQALKETIKPFKLYQFVVSSTRAEQLLAISTAYKHPYRLKQPTPAKAVSQTVEVKAQQAQRILAFNHYLTQFNATQRLIWSDFVKAAPYEEFIDLSALPE